MKNFSNGEHALNLGILAFGFALLSEDHERVGRIWQIRSHANQLPNREDVQEMVESARAELGKEATILECYVRLIGPERMESASSLEHATIEIAELILSSWDTHAQYQLTMGRYKISDIFANEENNDSLN